MSAFGSDKRVLNQYVVGFVLFFYSVVYNLESARRPRRINHGSRERWAELKCFQAKSSSFPSDAIPALADNRYPLFKTRLTFSVFFFPSQVIYSAGKRARLYLPALRAET